VGDRVDEVRQPGGKQTTMTGSGTKTSVIPKVVYQDNAQNMEDIGQIRRGRGRTKKERNLGAEGGRDKEPPDPVKGSVPDKITGRCLDPELPGTGLQKEGGKGPGPPYSGEKSQLGPSRDGENEERWRKTCSHCDEGGSAANRVRRLLPLLNRIS
jgi:hypothetical protein